MRVIGSMGRLGRLPDAEDERLSSLAGREEAILVPVSARNHNNNFYMEYLTSREVARRADTKECDDAFHFGRIARRSRGNVLAKLWLAGRATCEEALETSSVLCFQPCHTYYL